MVYLHHGNKNNIFYKSSSITFNLIIFILQINGDTIMNALKIQVVQYTIQTSLFDIILAAFVRFLFLIIFYGILAMNHWSIIAVGYFFSYQNNLSFQLINILT